jgi:hypothetical protein
LHPGTRSVWELCHTGEFYFQSVPS